jgi:plasmid segregation protein ParM
MNIMKTRLIGLDPGFGGVKVAEVQAGEMHTHHVPSVVGVGTTDAGALSLAGVVRGARRGALPHVVAFNGAEYLVGANVHRYARPIERMDMARFTEGPELRALLYVALYRLLDGGGHRLALAAGLPVEVLQDAELARATERQMAHWLTGRHRFTLDGTGVTFEVVKVRAKIAQPVATWFDWGLNLAGQWARGRVAARAPCLVVDQGFNTLDLLVVEGGRISTRYTSGDRLGMRRAAEMTARNVGQRHGVELSLHEADRLVRQVVGGKQAHTYVLGQRTEVTPLVRQAVNALAADVVRFVERNVGAGRKFQVLLTGGGALALAPRLLRQYPHAQVVDDPVQANARGLAKLAVRPGFLITP